MGTMYYMAIRYETYEYDEVAWAAGGMATDSRAIFTASMDVLSTRMSAISNSFLFFPSFLSIGFVGFAVSRWQSFQANGYTIQGRVQDVGMLVSGAVIDPTNRPTQQLIFHIYRYLNLAHVLGYIGSGKERTLALLEDSDWVKLGLTTQEESDALAKTPFELRDVLVLSWIGQSVQHGFTSNLLASERASAIDLMLHELRMYIATTGAIAMTKQPNLWASLMNMVVNLLLLLYLVGLPFTCFTYDSGFMQYFTIITSALLTFPWVCMGALIQWLTEPFHSKRDAMNIDGLVCWSERVTFTQMRMPFSEAMGGRGPASMSSQSGDAASSRSRPSVDELSEEQQ